MVGRLLRPCPRSGHVLAQRGWAGEKAGLSEQPAKRTGSAAPRDPGARHVYGREDTSCAQRKPTLGSCSVGSPLVRKVERSR